ncbi:MAG: aminoacyl-histidine dipeptidase, partial [Bacteroidales bacterium]|nr:aminoacyl-histidine dipeptidase [Bacteroidales bacterium]
KLKPERVWEIFYELTRIPRPSKKEQKAMDFARKFGEDLGLETIVDKVGNVIIRKPASPGNENKMGVILQAHLDMVPQKNSDKKHDFENDPIETIIDGEWVRADGTTLGADNGIGAAAAMAVLKSNDLVHGPVEVLLTLDEETGMTGAFELGRGLLKGDILLNLDSEDEGELYIGCAGGMNTSAAIEYKEEKVPSGHIAFRVEVKGLKGGHSGLDIHLGRGNANKLMNRFLWEAGKKLGLRISSLEGGSLRNAIPREAFAVITIPAGKRKEFSDLVAEFNTMFRTEFAGPEPGLQFSAAESGLPEMIMEQDAQERMIKMVYGIPHGVMRMSADMPGVVETSTNLAIVNVKDGKVNALCLIRSAVDSAKLSVGNMTQAVMELAGAKVSHDGTYPGWKPDVDSTILKTMTSVYEKKYGKTPEVKVIHAGLECGIIGDAYPNLDMISFGPTIRFPHSPDEKVNIETVQKFWDYLTETLKNVPVK